MTKNKFNIGDVVENEIGFTFVIHSISINLEENKIIYTGEGAGLYLESELQKVIKQ